MMKTAKSFKVLLSVSLVWSISISLQASQKADKKFSISAFKGIIIKPEGSLLPAHVVDSPYVGSSVIFTELPPDVADEGFPSKSFHFDSELNSPSIISDYGVEIAVKGIDDTQFFFGLSHSELIATGISEGVTFPMRGIANNKATYSRKISARNQYFSLGLEKRLQYFTNDIDISIRSSLQLVKSELRDWHYFAFTSSSLEGQKRYDQYTLNIPATYALELGFNGAYHINKHVSLALYAGYLFDVSKNEYQIGSRNDNFVGSDEINTSSQLWNGDIDGNANILSDDGLTYVSSSTDFTSWQFRVKIGVSF